MLNEQLSIMCKNYYAGPQPPLILRDLNDIPGRNKRVISTKKVCRNQPVNLPFLYSLIVWPIQRVYGNVSSLCRFNRFKN